MMNKHEHKAPKHDAVLHCQVCCKEIPRSIAKRIKMNEARDFKWFFCGPRCHSVWELGLLDD